MPGAQVQAPLGVTAYFMEDCLGILIYTSGGILGRGNYL